MIKILIERTVTTVVVIKWCVIRRVQKKNYCSYIREQFVQKFITRYNNLSPNVFLKMVLSSNNYIQTLHHFWETLNAETRNVFE